MCVAYMQYYAFLYKELEHTQILVSAGDPGTNSLWILRATCISILKCRIITLWKYRCVCVARCLLGREFSSSEHTPWEIKLKSPHSHFMA